MDDRDQTPILMSEDQTNKKNKRGLKNSFFITNALYNADPDSKKIQDVQNSYFATASDHQNDKDEQTKFNVSQTH